MVWTPDERSEFQEWPHKTFIKKYQYFTIFEGKTRLRNPNIRVALLTILAMWYLKEKGEDTNIPNVWCTSFLPF